MFGRLVPIVCLIVCFISVPVSAQFGDLLKGLFEKGMNMSPSTGLSQDTIVSGLKEALQVGAQKTIERTGIENGYYGNEDIKILMPKKLQMFDQVLRFAGYGPQLDEFVVRMNRAAEHAAPLAKPILWEAIASMTIKDAKGVLQGGNTAATDYFQEKTTVQLRKTFRPQVEQAMNQVDLVRQYKELVGSYQAIPFVRDIAFDLDQYVVDKSLSGFFTVLAEEEKQIRTDPAARVTDLLKEVFAQ
ncbi:MAG: DUF4197 family protein [Nitrospirales bacterium]|nr:DUF4197 family protein [Nitrospirales bacterium]